MTVYVYTQCHTHTTCMCTHLLLHTCMHTHMHTHTHRHTRRHRELESQVSELRAELPSELEKCQSEMKVSQKTHSNQLQALERENDLLREQLKKYVGMVQAQRRESSAKTTESAVQMAVTSSGNLYISTFFVCSMYTCSWNQGPCMILL